MRTAKAAAVALAFLISASALFAQAGIDGINWQLAKVREKKNLPFEPVSEITLEPRQVFRHRLRAVVAVRNPSARPAEGLVLRCALSLHIAGPDGAPGEGFWAVPFRIEELRISKIPPGGTYQARLIHLQLNAQLKKLKNTGFRADALKLTAMLEPRPGDDPAQIVRESAISIRKP